MDNKSPGSGWWAPLGLPIAAAILIALPKATIGYFDLVQRPQLTAETRKLAEEGQQDLAAFNTRIEQLESGLRSEQEETTKIRRADEELNQRLDALAVLAEKAVAAPLQFSRFDHTSSQNVARAEISTASNAVAVVTAYAQGIATTKQKQRSLGILLTVNDQPCASDKSSTWKEEDGDLFVSAACITRLRTDRKNIIAAARTRESVRGQVYLQYVIFNVSNSAIADFATLATADRAGVGSP